MKTYFEQNREQFDTERLPENHFDVFSEKLHKQKRLHKRFQLTKVAAVAILLILSGYFLKQEIVNSSIDKEFVFCYQALPGSVPEDIQNADLYYAKNVIKLQKECLNAIPASHFMARIDYIQHMGQYYNSRCELVQKLESEPNNQALYSALIRQYQMVEKQQSALAELLRNQKMLN